MNRRWTNVARVDTVRVMTKCISQRPSPVHTCSTTVERKGLSMSRSETASDQLVQRLVDWGIDVVFGLPGDGINGVMESLRTHADRIRFIHVRHEETAALAACS